MSTVLDSPVPEIVKVEPFIDENRYEIIDGEIVETPPMSADSAAFAFDLAWHLRAHGVANNLGKAYTEILIQLPLPVERNRRPDVIFVPYEHWPQDRRIPDTNAWDVLPSLCVEVVSPNDLAEEIMDKLHEYFTSGVKQVWIAYPRHGLLFVHESPAAVRVLSRNDVLEGGAALPGFRLPLSELFPKSDT